MTPAAPVIQVEGFVKHYGNVEAVRCIDLEVRRGEVFRFLGPNGAGKSTTIRCLFGLLQPTAGRIKALGLDSVQDGRAASPDVIRSRRAAAAERVSAIDLVSSIGRLRGGLDHRRRDELAERLRLDLH